MILNNIIEGGGVAEIGISFGGSYNINISKNVIYGCKIGIRGQDVATIGGNLIINNDDGLEISSTGIQIQNNTIADNSVGIRLLARKIYGGMTIMSNNIQNNRQNSIYIEDAPDDAVTPYRYRNTPGDVNAPLNWWGTIDQQLINLTIHDKKNEPKLGTVNFVPTLSSPVAEAPTTEYTPIELPSQEPATTTPEQSATRTTTQIGIYEIAIAAIILSVAINISLVIVVARLLKKKD